MTPKAAMDRRNGLTDELQFWRKQISGSGEYSLGVLSRLDLSKQPPEYRCDFEPLILQLAREVDRPARVLDVGSGPASIFSWGYRQGRFDLVAADPLAEDYERLLSQHGYAKTSPMVACNGEELSSIFPADHFDFAWSFNSIDHAKSPRRVFEAMIGVTRPGGLIVVQCFENEGTEASWAGLHQHDVTRAPSGDMMRTSKDGESEVLMDARCELVDLGITPNYVPKTEGRAWLNFSYRRKHRIEETLS